MNNVPDFDRLIEPFMEIYKKIEHDLIVHIATHFQLYENIGFKNSMEWYIRKVEELGGLNQQTVDLISKQLLVFVFPTYVIIVLLIFYRIHNPRGRV